MPPLDKKTLEVLGNPKTEDVLKATLKHNAKMGGSRTISYKGDTETAITAPLADILAAIEFLQANAQHPNKYRVMLRVNRYIERNYEKVKSGKASQATAMKVMQDIAFWFANEVVEGRETLDMN